MEELIKKLVKQNISTERELDLAKRVYLRTHKEMKNIPRKKDLLKVYHNLLKKNKIKRQPQLERLMVKRAVRTMSGVTIVTVLTKPYPCPGKCIYCPDEKKMPKSYISDEPAAARALKLGFDPYEQVVCRIQALQDNGHPTDKIELIVKGGSWNAYPEKYQCWFILRCFEACNGRGVKGTDDKKKLDTAQKTNEKAKHRIIGITLETRPDMINEKTIKIMRKLGCTRIEMGVQTIDEQILKLIKREHTARDVITATKLLKQYGFKVDYHLMPQLPRSTPAKDLKMMKKIFSNSDYRPDMIKIYPCTVIENTALYRQFKKGQYKPYADNKLIEILVKLKASLPYFVRISRLIRDIPSHHVQAGNKLTNLRQVIQKEMHEQGLSCNCLRCREIGHRMNVGDDRNDRDVGNDCEQLSIPTLFIDRYEASGGDEYFLSYEDPKRTMVYAFCRFRIDPNGIFPAFIRELHTYGQLVQIGKTQKKATQHKGLGKKLMKEVEKICRKNKIKKLAVISGIGVRGYYRKNGYRLESGYMVRSTLR